MIEITEEMVRRGAEALFRADARNTEASLDELAVLTGTEFWTEYYEAKALAVLEAALAGEDEVYGTF